MPPAHCPAVQRHFFSLRIALLVIVAGIGVAGADLWWRGFVVVHDPAGLIRGATLEDGGGQVRALHAFAEDYWAARPVFDGSVRLRCRNGASVSRAEVMKGAQVSYTVTRDDCRRQQ